MLVSHMFGTFRKRGSGKDCCASCGGTNGELESHRCIIFDPALADSLLDPNLTALRMQRRKNPNLAHKSAPEYR